MNNRNRTFYWLLLLSSIWISGTGSYAATQTKIDLATLSNSTLKTLKAHHYRPDELHSQPFLQTWQQVEALASQAHNLDEFVQGFNQLWQDGPFSHVNLSQSPMQAETLAKYLDNLNVGPEAVSLAWHEDIAILTVTTMMGSDTIEGIIQAYEVISKRPTKALIIDLRANEGGAFAIRPLVSQLIDEPLDAGFFVSQAWWQSHVQLPTVEDLQALKPWQGWSIQSFWHAVADAGLIKVRFEPQSPRLKMPVFILTSARTASAAELAIQTLQASGRAIIVGEATAGKMLSQKPFDVAPGIQLFVPVADYFTITGNRLEGRSIQPDKVVKAEQALTFALQLTGQ